MFPKIFKEICNFDNCNIDIQVSGCNIETLDSCQNCTFLLNLVNTGWEAAMCKPLCGLSKNCREGSSCNEDIWSTPAFWSWGVSICCWYWSSHSNQVSHPWLKEIHKVYVTQPYDMIKLYMRFVWNPRASEVAFCLLGPSWGGVCNNNFLLFVVC